MTDTDHEINYTEILAKFPSNEESSEDKEIKADKQNPAIRLYGRRFRQDQTPIEYLAEFLLVFSSSKSEQGDEAYKFTINPSSSGYYPENRIALKLFSFFPYSKLETRHPIHRQAYLDCLELVRDAVSGCVDHEKKDEAVRLIQSLFHGFVGVAKNRTWVTYTFMPASISLLARELDWLNSKAIEDKSLKKWDSDQDIKKYFAADRHNFMARGGEVLFLQLANLFLKTNDHNIKHMLEKKEYQHINKNLANLKENLEEKLRQILEETIKPIGGLAQLIENRLEKYKLDINKKANLGWAPAISKPESLLFAHEMNNICSSKLDALDKLELLKTLCCLQVLRSLCFQANRIDDMQKKTAGFIGQYAWVASDPQATINTPIRQIAQISFDRIDRTLFRVLRKKEIQPSKEKPKTSEAEKHGYQIFKKISKEIGLVIPIKGQGQRFTLNQNLLRFLVAALIKPGERVRLTVFYQRVFAHYGIALGGHELTTALTWIGHESGGTSYAVSSSTAWIEEALQQGGFLVELSDAVSIVHNPA